MSHHQRDRKQITEMRNSRSSLDGSRSILRKNGKLMDGVDVSSADSKISELMVNESQPVPYDRKKVQIVKKMMKSLFADKRQPERGRERDDDFESYPVPSKRHRSNSNAISDAISIHQSSNPDLLATPKIKSSSFRKDHFSSAFQSESCDNLLDNIRNNSSVCNLMSNIEEQVARNVKKQRDNMRSSPPRIKTPPIVRKYGMPRTVAQKREFIEQNPIEYQILDFESAVYHLIRKRNKFGENGYMFDKFFTQVTLLMDRQVPMKRDVLKAVKWLNGEIGTHFPCNLTIDSDRVRVVGATGLSKEDIKPILTSALYQDRKYQPQKMMTCCQHKHIFVKLANEPELIAQLTEGEQEIKKSGGELTVSKARPTLGDTRMKLASSNGPSTKGTFPLRPGPLSSKIKQLSQCPEKDGALDSLEIYRLPMEFITAVPAPNKIQPKRVRSYLKLALPDKRLTEDWLDYALTTVASEVPREKKSFQFAIPYKNDQQHILVRRIQSGSGHRQNCENFEEQMKHPLSFKDTVQDKDDKVEMEVANIVGQMIDSVALSFSEDSFIRDDPDLDYKQERGCVVVPIRTTAYEQQHCETIKRRKTCGKIVSELRRLNATIISAEEFPENTECDNDHCKFGCICESIAKFSTSTTHCTKADCIFGCRCNELAVVATGPAGGNTALDKGNALQREMMKIRDARISRLARVEKDFTSTIVLTNSNTILMRNADDTKRNRCKPKRYDDFLDPEESSTSNTGGQSKKSLLSRKWAPELDRLRHCAVVLPDIDEHLLFAEPFCMTHELYRCFCYNRRVDGLPFQVCPTKSGQLLVAPDRALALANKKRQYSFAKDESQDTLQPILMPGKVPRYSAAGVGGDLAVTDVEHLLDGETTAARCRPINTRMQFEKNRKKAPEARLEATRALRYSNLERLKELVDACCSFTPVSRKMAIKATARRPRPSVVLPMTAEEPAPPQIKQEVVDEERNVEENEEEETEGTLILDGDNDLGLKISSIRTLTEDSPTKISPTKWAPTTEESHIEMPPPTKAVSSRRLSTFKLPKSSDSVPFVVENEELLKMMNICKSSKAGALKDRLNSRIKELLQMFESTKLGEPALGEIKFISMRQLSLLVKSSMMAVFEIWLDEDGQQVELALARNVKTISRIFPHACKILNTHSDQQDTKAYLSRFLVKPKRPQEAANVFAVLQGTGDTYWKVSGCQFMKKPLRRTIQIGRGHLERLKAYASRITGKSNIGMVPNDNFSTHLELPNMPNSKWFVLRIEDDFTDITHPKWPGLLSYDSIVKAIGMAQRDQKTIVMFSSKENVTPNIYAVRNAPHNIFIGPYEMNKASQLTLYHRLDNNLHLREEYQQMLKIKRLSQTTGFWLYVDRPSRSAALSEDGASNMKCMPNKQSTSVSSMETSTLPLPLPPPNDSGVAQQKEKVELKVRPTLELMSQPAPSLTATTMPAIERNQEVTQRFSIGSTSVDLPDLQIIPIPNEIEQPQMLALRSENEPKNTPVLDPILTLPMSPPPPPPPPPPLVVDVILNALPSLSAPLTPLSAPAPPALPLAISLQNEKELFGSDSGHITKILNDLKDSRVNSFKLGNTTVVRRDAIVTQIGGNGTLPGVQSSLLIQSEAGTSITVDARPGPSSVPDAIPAPPPSSVPIVMPAALQISTGPVYEILDDDDVVLIEDDDEKEIIDLDKWEEEQREGEEDENDPSELKDPLGGDGDASSLDDMSQISIHSADVKQEQDPLGDSHIPMSGYYESEIKELGQIPAKIRDGTVSLYLPIRSMPMKIGVNCVNRYMWRYITNAVCACVPSNLTLSWTFRKGAFPKEQDKFKLISTPERKYIILTGTGIIHVLKDEKTEKDLPDSSVYLKYLVSRLCALIYDELIEKTGVEVIQAAIETIQKENLEFLSKQTRISFLKSRQQAMLAKLEKIKAENFKVPA